MKSLSIYLTFLISATCYAQQKVSFTLLDQSTNQPIKNAYIYTHNSNTTSRKNGRASIELNGNETILHLSHVSFRDTSISFTPQNLPDTIKLTRSIHVLNQVEISTRPYIVFQSEEYHVFDYEFAGDTVLILTYEREKMFRKAEEQSESLFLGCQLLLVSHTGNVLLSRKLEDEIIGFYRDPLNQIYIESKNRVFYVKLKPELSLQSIDRGVFEEQIKPLKATLENVHVIDNYRWHYPEFSYFSFNPKSDSMKHIRTVKDNFTMELLRSEYKYMSNRDKLWAYRKEIETGVDKEVISAYKMSFQSSPYYQSLYAPVFTCDTSIVIFDHHAEYIFRYSSKHNLTDSVELRYINQSQMKFGNLIVKDRKRDIFYSVFKKGCSKYLCKIDMNSGESVQTSELYYPFPENIKLKDGTAYYLYRKPESKNFTYLFAESIE